jgi:ribosomal protein L37AE/L43A
MKRLNSEPLECDECGRLTLGATYDPATHIVTYYCEMCHLEFYDNNLDFDREDVASV